MGCWKLNWVSCFEHDLLLLIYWNYWIDTMTLELTAWDPLHCDCHSLSSRAGCAPGDLVSSLTWEVLSHFWSICDQTHLLPWICSHGKRKAELTGNTLLMSMVHVVLFGVVPVSISKQTKAQSTEPLEENTPPIEKTINYYLKVYN